MMTSIRRKHENHFRRFISAFIAFTFSFTSVLPPAYAQVGTTILNLPVPGTMVPPSPAFVPVLLKGMTIHPDNPLQFDFIVDSGNTNFKEDQIKTESQRLVKYFLASMTIPRDDLWVNLSPYESDKIIPDELGRTELGRDMLAQDYILKQLTASLMYPEKELGKEFWDRVYKKAEEKYGTSEIPVNTFNKVWILPDTATVYEHGQTVYIVDAKLKVMLDADYIASGQGSVTSGQQENLNTEHLPLSTEIIREIILPEIEKEVNEGKNFAPLRQIYHSLILAKWYKETIKESLLSKVYIDQKKIAGVDINDPTLKDQIYVQYMEAYKKGVFNYIKEDYNRLSNETIPRKYFSGGIKGDVNIKRIERSGPVRGLLGKGFMLLVALTSAGMLSTPQPVFAQQPNQIPAGSFNKDDEKLKFRQTSAELEETIRLLEDVRTILDKNITREEADRRIKDLRKVFAALDARMSFHAGMLPEPLSKELSQSIENVFKNVHSSISLLSVVDTPEYDRLKLLLTDYLGAPDIARDETTLPANIAVLLEAVNKKALSIVMKYLTSQIDRRSDQIAQKQTKLDELKAQKDKLAAIREKRTRWERLKNFSQLAEEENRIEEISNEFDVLLKEAMNLGAEQKELEKIKEKYSALGGNLNDLLMLTDENIRRYVTDEVLKNYQLTKPGENLKKIKDAVTVLDSVLQWTDTIEDLIFKQMVAENQGKHTYTEIVNIYTADETVRLLEDQRSKIKQITGRVLYVREMILKDIQHLYSEWGGFVVKYVAEEYSKQLAKEEAGLWLKFEKYKLRLFLHQLSVQDPQLMNKLHEFIDAPTGGDILLDIYERAIESDNERIMREDDFAIHIYKRLEEQSIEGFMDDFKATVTSDPRRLNIVEAMLELIKQGSEGFRDWRARFKLLEDSHKLDAMLSRIEQLASQVKKMEGDRLEYKMLKRDYLIISAQLRQIIPELALDKLGNNLKLKAVLEEIINQVTSQKGGMVPNSPGHDQSSSPIFGGLFGSKFKEEINVSERSWKRSILLLKLLEKTQNSIENVQLLKTKSLTWMNTDDSFSQIVALNTLRFLYKKSLINIDNTLKNQTFTLLESDSAVSVKLAALDFFGAMAAKGVDMRFDLPTSDASKIIKFREEILKKSNDLREYEKSGVLLDIDRLMGSEDNPQKLLNKIISEIDQNGNSSSPAVESRQSSDIRHQSEVKALKTDDGKLTTNPGGIDMNAIDLDREGIGVDIQFDPVEFQQIIDAGIDGFAPVIINITPLPSVLPLLGLEPRKEEYAEELSRLD